MAVLCEAISVVVRAKRALDAFGSFETFKQIVPNETLAADNELMRVGFMVPDDVKAFIDRLERHGLIYIRDRQAVDLVVVDQMRGPMIPCEWLEFGKIPLSGGEVSAARLKGSTSKQLFTPDGWQLEGSLSQTFGFSPTSADRKGLRFLRREGSVDVYFNELTGKEVYLGRADGAGD